MPRATFTFLNHASFMVRTDAALLVSDPWLGGEVQAGAWGLIDGTDRSASVLETLNAAGVPIYIWCSRAQPDHLSLPFLRRLRAELRGIATFLYRPGRDRRIVDELRRLRLPVAQCRDGVPVGLSGDLRLTALANGDGDTACLISCGGRNILNLGDRALASAAACQSAAARVGQLAPRVDLLLTGFGSMGWCGNPEQYALREAAAKAAVERLALQVERFRPKLVVPIASFARFARADNLWLNGGRIAPAELLEHTRLEQVRSVIRFLAPGASVDLQRDTPATLAPAHVRALEHWSERWRNRPPPLPRPPQASLGELKAAFSRYRERLAAGMHVLPWLLETVGPLKPLLIHLPDLRQTVELSYRHGFRLRARETAAHVAMFSGTALQLLRMEDGFDTVYAGGCFWTLRRSGLSTFGRFFLPQRMGRRGADRRRPLAMGGYLWRALVGKVGRQLQAALR
ncbi:hypothetical protein [Massilia yuzhufengensis]|uniref:L-ascorbate metabolism protein UlaG, beta-lactamase superfamily n=1 Tax=Massilia yuzhufengensis TaxID=1164594 RepID=A0A1I1TVR9_9BURK|nr:hypothetical protein [Massilia yuzhufengensis]SFD62731.1 L-ascorbate metabolism protein UlaG, beta-lactamase superfamily [Massilia yuzhufengensis]